MARSATLNLEAVRHSRLSDNIAGQLERLIVNNELHIGDALPSERELAAHLQVSRNILREAISMLAQKGLLEVRPGSGTFVASPTADFLRDSLELFLRFSGTALLDLVEARRSIEVEIAELAATRATEEDRDRIAQRLAELEATVDLPEAYVDADIRFHAELAHAAKNVILELLLESIRGATRENIRVVLLNHPPAVVEAMGYHRRIAQAIQSHSPESARTAMREHLESVRSQLQQGA
jgi:GntR family transcriptional repressor for pyruvate dehydrogenase complex